MLRKWWAKRKGNSRRPQQRARLTLEKLESRLLPVIGGTAPVALVPAGTNLDGVVRLD